MAIRRRRYRSRKSTSRCLPAQKKPGAGSPRRQADATEPSCVDHGSDEIQGRLDRIARHYEELEQILGQLENDGSVLVAQLSTGSQPEAQATSESRNDFRFSEDTVLPGPGRDRGTSRPNKPR